MLRLVFAYFFCILASSHAAGIPNPYFRKDYIYKQETQSFYKLQTSHRTWSEARQRCKLEGAELFVPENLKDAEIGVELMKTKGFLWIYVGLQDILAEGDFTTIDGVSVDDVYNQWDGGEPNDANGEEDCVILKNNAKLNDDSCNKKYPSICKKARVSVVWNTECDSPYTDYKYDKTSEKCYKFHLNPMNWTEANGVCRAEQSYLAVINSKAEADLFVRMTEQAPKDGVKGDYLRGVVLLGFHNQFGDGFHTVLGQPLDASGYTEWGNNQPDNVNNHEKCGSMFNNGKLNDIWCGSRAFFICEHDVNYLTTILDERFGDDRNRNTTVLGKDEVC